MKIATWNVNSIRAREERLAAWLDRHQPDAVALQEIKVIDADFPRELFTSRGYAVEVFGQPTYNGVAIASKSPLTDVRRGLGAGDPAPDEKRLLAATTAGFRLINVYVVNGQEPGCPAYAKKLAWLARLVEVVAEELAAHRALPLVLLGDFNIAPSAADLWDAALEGGILATEAERAAFAALAGLGLTDLFRRFETSPGLYTFWDYRELAFQKRRGFRIDHLLTNALATERAEACAIDKDERRGQKPSDHAPVIGTFR